MSSIVEGWHVLRVNVKVVMIMGRACRNEAVTRAIEKMWMKQITSVLIPHQPG